MKLLFHSYKYYPYERQLALREASALLGPHKVRHLVDGVELVGRPNSDTARRLVYFSQIHSGVLAVDTVQACLERAVTAGKKRQATRYSVHGLHEYKGKFNPQTGKAILNIFGVRAGDRVLDPFCGSGTTLVECAHIGAHAAGIDLNPLAVFIANAKLRALAMPSAQLFTQLSRLERSLDKVRNWSIKLNKDARGCYLQNWFNEDILSHIEIVRNKIETHTGQSAPIFLCIASNLLRDYSQQDPNDLRIRRRSSPLPSIPFWTAFLNACRTAFLRLAEAQLVLGMELPRGAAQIGNTAEARNVEGLPVFDAALTSPPYATALPYIDTQRLSLVWLGLLEPNQILPLEADLIGSREMRGRARQELRDRLGDNAERLPAQEFEYCNLLQGRVGPKDGFRRKAVPCLLYRYFAGMQDSFRVVRKQLRKNAPYALIVGHNHTVLAGVRHDIDTPRHLASLATHVGWQLDEIIELQTYQRYGYHMDNAVSAESLILLRNP
jgi:hypothetical protein